MAPPPGMIRRDISAVNPFLKYFIFLFNFVFLIISIATIVLTSLIMHEKDKTITSFMDILLDPSLMLLIVACIGLVITYLGTVGALRENESLLKVYSHIVTFFIFVQVVGVVFVFLFYYYNTVLVTFNIYPENLFKSAIIKYRDDADQHDFIDYWQKQMDCCGFSDDDEGYRAWNNNVYFNCTPENKSAERCAVPWSCCVLNDGDRLNLLCGGGALKALTSSSLKDQIYTRGCLKAVRVWVGSNVFVFGCVVIAVLVPQVLSICFARNLNEQIEMQKAKWEHH